MGNFRSQVAPRACSLKYLPTDEFDCSGGALEEVSSFWVGALKVGHKLDMWSLCHAIGGWQALENASVSQLIELGVSPQIVSQLCGQRSIRTRGMPVVMGSPFYPARLRNVPHAPPVLFVEGNVRVLDSEFKRGVCAVVGTRSSSPEGRWLARRISHGLASRGDVVVSGLARGIDTVAHDASSSVGQTIAVLAHGLDFTAPTQNRSLRSKILRENGAVISTWPDDTPPRPFRFPMRNRWIAGLSDCVVVVEAPQKSGAIHTANAGFEMGREVFAVPGSPDLPNRRGCLDLIVRGARVLVSVEEFLNQGVGSSNSLGDSWVLHVLRGVDLGQVSRISGLSIREMLIELSIMESKGLVIRDGGMRYSPGPKWYAMIT